MSGYVLTPNGISIAKDDSNVGHKMLKKMGWTPEAGLGKNEDGIVEPVRASCNYGRKGLGKATSQSSTNMPQQLAYNTILQALNKHKSPVCTGAKTKLEAKSKHCRSRVHYGKFIRAKDVSQYPHGSLQIVLGSTADEVQNPSENITNSSPRENNESQSADIKMEYGVKTYSNTTDLISYFSMKRTELNNMKLTGGKRKCSAALGDEAISTEESPPKICALATVSGDLEEKEIPHSGESVDGESSGSGLEGTMTEEKPFVVGALVPGPSFTFSTSNLHSLPGYPFY